MTTEDRKTSRPAPVWRLKVELIGVSPKIWRRFDTFADVELSQLHYCIQGVMGWELAHLFCYQDGYGTSISEDLHLCDVCGVGDDLKYAYDFGDDWQHLITVEKVIAQPAGPYPALIAGKNACPPEDCGGPWGYADLVKVLAGRPNARRRELMEWLDDAFDPKAFDIEEAKERLAQYVALSVPKPDVTN